MPFNFEQYLLFPSTPEAQLAAFESIRMTLLERAKAALHPDNYLTPTQRQAWTAYMNILQDANLATTDAFPDEPAAPAFPLTSEQIASRLEVAGYLQTIATQYETAINRLIAIETAGVIPFTQAGFNQVVQAVKDEAKYIRLIAQALKRLLT
jgi:hypothetical protein